MSVNIEDWVQDAKHWEHSRSMASSETIFFGQMNFDYVHRMIVHDYLKGVEVFSTYVAHD